MDREQASNLVADALSKHNCYATLLSIWRGFENTFGVDAAEEAASASKRVDAAFEDSEAATDKLVELLCGEKREEKTAFELITEAAKLLRLEVSGYTPRGVDKRVVLSVSCPNMATVIRLGQHIGNPHAGLPAANADSLGGHYVVYWPKIEFEFSPHNERSTP